MKIITLTFSMVFLTSDCFAVNLFANETALKKDSTDSQLAIELTPKQALKNIVLTNDGRPLKFYPRHNFKSNKGLESYINSVKSILETSSDKELHEIFEDDKKVINLNCVVHKDYVGPSNKRRDFCWPEADRELALIIVNMINSGGCFADEKTYMMPAVACVKNIPFKDKSSVKTRYANPLNTTFFVEKVNLYEKPDTGSSNQVIDAYTFLHYEGFGSKMECLPSGKKGKSSIDCTRLWTHYSTTDGKAGYILNKSTGSIRVYKGQALIVHKKNGKWGDIELLNPHM